MWQRVRQAVSWLGAGIMQKLEMTGNPHWKMRVFSWVCWIASGFFFLAFLRNSGWLPKTPATIYDLSYLIASFVYLVVPFVSRARLGNLIDIETRLSQDEMPADAAKAPSREEVLALRRKSRPAIEYKILQTLWNKQVGKFPDVNAFFTFGLFGSPSPEWIEFHKACFRLMGEGLIAQNAKGQFYLTWTGLKYCLDNYENFPTDMWFEPEPITPEAIEKVRNKINEVYGQRG